MVTQKSLPPWLLTCTKTNCVILVYMDKYKFKVALWVEVEAFDEDDALDALRDVFATGTEGAVVINECEYKQLKK